MRSCLPENEKAEDSTRRKPVQALPEIFRDVSPKAALRQSSVGRSSSQNAETSLDIEMRESQISNDASQQPVSQVDSTASQEYGELTADDEDETDAHEAGIDHYTNHEMETVGSPQLRCVPDDEVLESDLDENEVGNKSRPSHRAALELFQDNTGPATRHREIESRCTTFPINQMLAVCTQQGLDPASYKYGGNLATGNASTPSLQGRVRKMQL